MAAGDAIVQLPFDGTASANRTALLNVWADGKIAAARPGTVNIDPDIPVPQRGAALIGAGASDGTGSPVRGTVFNPTTGQGVDAVFRPETAGRLMNGMYFNNFTVKGPSGEYHAFRFDGMGNGCLMQNINCIGCRSGVLLNNAFDADNSISWHSQIVQLRVEQHTEGALALIRSTTNPGSFAVGVKLGVYGLHTTNPSGGRSLVIDDVATLDADIEIHGWGFEGIDGETLNEAVLITTASQINLGLYSGVAELASGQNFINIDNTDHRISLVASRLDGTGTYPALAVRTPSASSDIEPTDPTTGLPVTILNGRIPTWQ